MVKAIFSASVDPRYDDLPEKQYHFPQRYLRAVEAALGDWIVYYEPRRGGGRLVYFATARLKDLQADPVRDGHYYAFVSDYLEFDHPVPFRHGDFYYESRLKKPDGSPNRGLLGHSVRHVSDQEYDLILQAGFANVLVTADQQQIGEKPQSVPLQVPGLSEGDDTDEYQIQPRQMVSRISNRPFRDRAFSVAVKTAYENTCAMTGLKIINGGGRSEVQAAHIMPVQHNGPDSIRNGIALCGTLHWMFDRGLVSIDDDFSLLLAGSAVPDTVERLVNSDRNLSVPERPQYWPHRQFLEYHRKSVFKG